MRLLNTRTIRFEVFYGNEPPYAILSHMWGRASDEATFQGINDSEGGSQNSPGYRKIRECCDQAKIDGFDYAWIDTCCIDKTNSVELQEAINSMFNWYKRSTVCYAYLSDYDPREGGALDMELFKASKWFMRGWTLQELIAPSKVVFYSRDWKHIGSKIDLGGLISSITEISEDVLAGQDLQLTSVAQRMSWASRRKTTRDEDMSYCLLGLFGVQMPLIYGEGAVSAFIRLQKVIMEESYDQSLFAWRQDHGPPGHGLLATSPALFAHSSGYTPNEGALGYRMSNRGLEIELSLTCTLEGGDHVAFLNCREVGLTPKAGLFLARMEDGRFIRTRLDQLAQSQKILDKDHLTPLLKTIYIPQMYLSEIPTEKSHHFQIIEMNGKISLTPGSAETHRIPWIKDMAGGLLNSSSWRNITYHLEVSTSSGRAPELNFSLKAGGRAGALFCPYKLGVRQETLPSIIIVFGVDLDGTVFRDISSHFVNKLFMPTFDKYIIDNASKPTKHDSIVNIGDMAVRLIMLHKDKHSEPSYVLYLLPKA